MKLLFILLNICLLAIVIAEPNIGKNRSPSHNPPLINRPKLPSSGRWVRSPHDGSRGSFVFNGKKHGNQQPSWNADYQHKIYENKNGHISLGGGLQKTPGYKREGHVGVEGEFRFRRSANPEPQGSIVLQGQKPMSGPERRPTWNLDYQHNIWSGKNGQIGASGGALKLPGQRVQPHIGIQGQWRFR